MYTLIGKLNVNTLAINRKANSPIYKIQVTDSISNCFYDPDNPFIELNDSAFIIQEISTSASHRIIDEYEFLITHVDSFNVTPNDTFTLKAEGKRLGHTMSTVTIDPIIHDIIRYKSALLIAITGDISQFIENNSIKPQTSVAREYFAKMRKINHLGIDYNYVTAAFTKIKSDLPDRPQDLVYIPYQMCIIYSSKEIPAQEDIEAVKHIYQRKIKPT